MTIRGLRPLDQPLKIDSSAECKHANVSSRGARGYPRVLVVAKHEKYLGLPAVMGKSKREVFNSLKDRLWRKLQSWT
ncbi:UNVERIFIED_CONTAM: hypothetical protein Sradi_0734500 [Sesamum radiatum]|uniref:RNA-directed DNA polymerase (Reverse transcriptase) n=1 Tax=Sesamum radiatum TaxID=300843 RepID=A0AAW2VSN6_SESRA